MAVNGASELVNRVEDVLRERDPEETRKMYEEWVKTYEQDMVATEYGSYIKAVNCFLDLNVPKTQRILDVGAGTGLVGSLLKKHGYKNIDALDGSAAMLKKAKNKGIYKNYIETLVVKDQKLAIDDGAYDVLIMNGVFCPGHMTSDVFPELLRITKKGGLICWHMRLPTAYANNNEEYGGGRFEANVKNLCKQGKWKHANEPIITDKFFNNHPGIFYAMEVC